MLYVSIFVELLRSRPALAVSIAVLIQTTLWFLVPALFYDDTLEVLDRALDVVLVSREDVIAGFQLLNRRRAVGRQYESSCSKA